MPCTGYLHSALLSGVPIPFSLSTINDFLSPCALPLPFQSQVPKWMDPTWSIMLRRYIGQRDLFLVYGGDWIWIRLCHLLVCCRVPSFTSHIHPKRKQSPVVLNIMKSFFFIKQINYLSFLGQHTASQRILLTSRRRHAAGRQ